MAKTYLLVVYGGAKSAPGAVIDGLETITRKMRRKGWHSRADTTANEYMQELPESVQQMVGTAYALLTFNAGSQMVN